MRVSHDRDGDERLSPFLLSSFFFLPHCLCFFFFFSFSFSFSCEGDGPMEKDGGHEEEQ
jgi:hypothetical protein